MQGDQNNQIVGEIQTPQPVTISAGQQAGIPYGAQPISTYYATEHHVHSNA